MESKEIIKNLNINLKTTTLLKNLSMAGTLACGILPIYVRPNTEAEQFFVGAGLILSAFSTAICSEKVGKIKETIVEIEDLNEIQQEVSELKEQFKQNIKIK